MSSYYSAQVVNSSQLSDGNSVHTEEPLSYQFEPKLTPEGNDIPVNVSNEVRTYQTIWTIWTKQELSIVLLL